MVSKFTLILLPLFVMLLSVLTQAGSAASGGTSVCFNPDGSKCTGLATLPVVPAGTQFRTDGGTNVDCLAFNPGPPINPSSWENWSPVLTSTSSWECTNSDLSSYEAGFFVAFLVGPQALVACGGTSDTTGSCNTWLYPIVLVQGVLGTGSTLIIPPPMYAFCVNHLYSGNTAGYDCTVGSAYSGGTGAASSSSQASFNFGPGQWTDMLYVAVGVAALLGITVFFAGINTESTHIIFMLGLLLGFWAVLTAGEGFVTGSSSTSWFTLLNAAIPTTGTILFAGLTLTYVLGCVMMVSRGGS